MNKNIPHFLWRELFKEMNKALNKALVKNDTSACEVLANSLSKKMTETEIRHLINSLKILNEQ